MPKYSYFYFFVFILLAAPVFSQKKTLNTKFTKEKIIVDGKFEEEIWQKAEVAKDFVMINPTNGIPIASEKRTEVRIVYDNNAVYIAANLYDNEPNKILSELTLRDNFAAADHFGVFINGYNDGQQEFRFYISAAGVQQDGVYTEANGEDFAWDAIWDSSVKVTDFGWTVEMKIPYAALRFSTEKTQTWGLNFYREIRRANQQYSWNFIDNKITNESTQAGILEGIENIETPTRLFLIPYFSQYLFSNNNQKTYGEFKGGMDIKYGINDAFTLDAILIPDFGQTKFDDVELNLTAFEQQFTENRAFFTEGTDLFSKGDLLYSRRIGGEPAISEESFQNSLPLGYEVVDFPKNINLINALKISGRTKKGLGIGVLNAITEKTYATIKNSDSGELSESLIEPLANYNEFVLDQRFNKNSSVSFVNTNVIREGKFRDANVSALVWDLNTKPNTYNLSGNFKYSFINEFGNLDNKNGINSYLELGETNGKFRYNIGGQYISRDYDNNDLGINFKTHYHAVYSNSSYRILKPNKTFNTFQASLDLYSEFDNNTGRIQSGTATINATAFNKKNDFYNFTITASPLKTYDFYEPRSFNDLKFVAVPESLKFSFLYSTNPNKRFVLETNPNYTFINEKNRETYGFTLSPKYRFNDHFSLDYGFIFRRQNNNVGWIDFDSSGNTIFARRDIISYTNTLEGKYSINNKMNFYLNVRHYWSYTNNNEILYLQDDGSVIPNYTYLENKNKNFNLWNLDLIYSWWFAPGSQMSILYRNNSFLYNTNFDHNFGNNFTDAMDNQNLDHIFSINVRYYIDYNSVKKSKFANSFTKPKTKEHF